jgi:hypothetical protein
MTYRAIDQMNAAESIKDASLRDQIASMIDIDHLTSGN